MRSFAQKCYQILLAQSLAHTHGKLRLVGILGALLYPGYYFVWKYVVPLPYESLTLRLVAGMFALPLIFETRLRRYPASLGVYWLISTTFCLPFFFTYMLLRNNYNVYWLGSALAAVVVLVLFFPSFRIALLVWITGSAGAYLAAYASLGALPPIELMAPHHALDEMRLLMGFGFVLIFIVTVTHLLNLHRRSVERSGIETINAWAATILHQTLTPISAVNLALQGIRPHVEDRPRLLAVVDSAIQEGHAAIRAAREILAFAVPPEEGSESRESTSASEAIRVAIETYPYGITGVEERRELIEFAPRSDFVIKAPAAPLIHVFQNLINNSMNAIIQAGRGEIAIQIRPGRRHNLILFRDNALGIAFEQLPFVFESYFTGRPAGLGLGLTYCRQFMRRVHGRIECNTRTGAEPFTEFLLYFPAT
jgi:two-component system CAI-1 autoinducer sensor kinase/phosphatase CqsS